MPPINIAAIISKMPKYAQREFLEKQTSHKGKGGNLVGFCSQDNWQVAATRAANAFFAKSGEPSPKSIEEQIGCGLIALAGQNPHFKGGRGAWNRDTEDLKVAVLAAGSIALSIRNLPLKLRSLLTQPYHPIDTKDAQPHQHILSVELELEQYHRDLEANGYFDPKNEIDARKRTATSIVQRAGQARFREQLLEAYGNRCAMTECDVPFSLEAAHILPYKGEYTNDVRNGLLLRADIHTVFDLGKISINPENYCVILANDIRQTSYSQLHGKPIVLPKDDRQKPDKEALDIHFKKSACST